MRNTPKGMRLHIAIFGRRNAGKSSLMNGFTRQEVSIVSEVKGTTTDPVEKPMELQPLGPVLLIDTAGIDDEGTLGNKRVERSKTIVDRTDIALLMIDGVFGDYEQRLLAQFRARKIPVIIVFGKTDVLPPSEELIQQVDSESLPWVQTAFPAGTGLNELRTLIVKHAPQEFVNTPSILADLIPPGELAVLVVPIDLEAPKGRLILPQVQCIRDILDNDSYCIVVKERELRDVFSRLTKPPVLVVTDSQSFLKVAGDTPSEIAVTSFSILFARFKGDLNEFVKGVKAIESLKNGDRVLVAEACTHHPVGDDIGRVKIPRWLTQYTGVQLEFDTVQSHDFPNDVSPYNLVIHCGACMMNRREVLTRIMMCNNAGVPITNYGLTIAYSLGICQRVLQPFPAALDILNSS